MKLLIELAEGMVVRVPLVGAGGVDNGLVVAEAGERIDMSVGIVPLKGGDLQHIHSVRMQGLPDRLGEGMYTCLTPTEISIGVQQDRRGGEDQSLSIALHSTALEDIVVAGDPPDVFGKNRELGRHLIVPVGGKLKPPGVEGIVHHCPLASVIDDGERRVVAHPGVIERHLQHCQPMRVVAPQRYARRILSEQDHRHVVQQRTYHQQVAAADFSEIISPIHRLVRPRQQDRILRSPLGDKSLRHSS